MAAAGEVRRGGTQLGNELRNSRGGGGGGGARRRGEGLKVLPTDLMSPKVVTAMIP